VQRSSAAVQLGIYNVDGVDSVDIVDIVVVVSFEALYYSTCKLRFHAHQQRDVYNYMAGRKLTKA